MNLTERTLGVLASIAILGTATGARASNVRKARAEFVKLWSDRETDYRSERTKDLVVLQAANDKMKNDPAFNLNDSPSSLQTALAASRSFSEINARGETIWQFLALMKDKPTPGLLSAWLQGKADSLTADIRDADAKDAAVRDMVAGRRVQQSALVQAMEEATAARTAIIGKAEELILLEKNVAAYNADYQAAGQMDAAAAERASRLGAALLAGQQRARWNASCIHTGDMTTCSGG